MLMVLYSVGSRKWRWLDLYCVTFVTCGEIVIRHSSDETICDVIEGKVIAPVYGRVTAIGITSFVIFTACDSTSTSRHVPELQEADTCGAMAGICITSAAPCSSHKTQYLGLVSPFRLQKLITGCGQDNGEVSGV
jgi:hypothetical protein